MGNPIPTRTREIVGKREGRRCIRCGSPRAHEHHHRRGRREADEHQHCPCNVILLCYSCHQVWAHAHPVQAREAGYIISRYIANPSTEPIETRHGLVLLTCDGRLEEAA